MAKLRKRGEAYQIDYFDKGGQRVRKSITDKADAIAELNKTGKPWTDETTLQPESLGNELVKVMTKLPANLLYQLKVCAAVRGTTIQSIIERGVQHELSKGPRLPFDK